MDLTAKGTRKLELAANRGSASLNGILGRGPIGPQGIPGDAGTAASYKQIARNPDLIITGTITRDVNGAATSAPVTWPDGTPGTYTATTVSSAFPGAVDAYTITYGSPVTKTYTQPLITRNASGAATNVPAITVA